MTDAQWAVIEPLLPPPGHTGGRGGPRRNTRAGCVLDAICYLVGGGVAWRRCRTTSRPADGVRLFHRWARAGAWQQIHDVLREQVRVHEGRDPAPTAAVIDSQSVKAADTVGAATSGFDGGNHAGRAVMPGSLLPVGVRGSSAGVRPVRGPALLQALEEGE